MTQSILASTATVTVGGDTLTIKEFGFGQIPAVAKHFNALVGNLTGGDIDLTALLADGGEDVLAIMGIAANKPRAWFDTLSMAEGVELLAATVNVNKESFTKNLLPALTKLTSAMVPATQNA